jgi:hypothetical protein
MIFGGIVPVAVESDTTEVDDAAKQTLNDNGTNVSITA